MLKEETTDVCKEKHFPEGIQNTGENVTVE